MVDRRVLGVLAGADLPIETLVEWVRSAEIVVAADGAANRLFSQGLMPDVVVGDLDSLSPSLRSVFPRIVEDRDQETSDCDKMLRYIRREGASSVVVAGLEGDRFDHVLAAVHSALQNAIPTRFVLRQGIAHVVHGGTELSVPSQPGQGVSFLPMLECAEVEMRGVRWAPKRTLSPLGATSLSNEATGDQVSIAFRSGAGLLILHQDSRVPIW